VQGRAEVSEWLKEHAWTCKRVIVFRGFDNFVRNEFGLPQAGPSVASGEAQEGRTIPRPLKKEKLRYGEVSEWLKEHAWKVCKRVIPLRGFESRSLRQLIFAG
jgi:hypothetical protein